jgi:hypothetical protein
MTFGSKAGLGKFIMVAALAGGVLAATLASADARGRYGWRGGGWGGGGWGGGGWGAGAAAAGLVGGLAVGALASQGGYYGYGGSPYPAYGYGGFPGYGGGGCYLAQQPVTDDWGNIVYYQRVRVCR